MGVLHVATSVLIAAAAMYGLGIALAWLLPAPAHSQWVLRIAVAPLLAIALTSPVSWILWLAGVPWHPWMLVAMAAGAWALAWPRIRRSGWTIQDSGHWQWPVLMLLTGAYLWWLALRDYGLYLPNRDFKNHAYNVAQFALDRGIDPIHTYSAGALATPEVAGLSRIGLHTLLAWALPTAEWNSLGVTAAAALLPSVVSLPLGLIVLARMWRPGSDLMWKLAGMCGVLFPGFTAPFSIGSMSLLFGAALFPAALATLWALWREPSWGRLLAVVVVGAGLAFTHIPEAAGLGLLVVLCMPRVAVRLSGVSGAWPRVLVGGGAIALVVLPAVVMFTRFPYLSEQRLDIQANDGQAWVGLLYPLVAHPSGPGVLRLLAAVLALLGIWMTFRERLSPAPVVVLGVFAVVSLGASWAAAPAWLRAFAAPWYGSAGRVSLLAGAAVVLLVCLPLSALGEGGSGKGRRGHVGSSKSGWPLACSSPRCCSAPTSSSSGGSTWPRPWPVQVTLRTWPASSPGCSSRARPS